MNFGKRGSKACTQSKNVEAMRVQAEAREREKVLHKREERVCDPSLRSLAYELVSYKE